MASIARRFVLPATIAIPSAAFAYQYRTDEGTQRSVKFWSNIFPIYLHYRTYQFLSRDLGLMSSETADQAYLELHEKYTDKVRDVTFEMRGFYLKQAQVMSTQDDFVPAAYMKWVKRTQDDVPSEFEGNGAKDYVVQVLRDELNMEFDDVFSHWEDKPLGIASIGQVHAAILRSTGEKVAVKILVPNIEKKFRSDNHTLKKFCRLAMPQHVSAFEEMERQFDTEFDYRREAENLARIRNAMFPRWENEIHIPRPHQKFCCKHLLVMEYLDGVKLVDGIRAKLGKVAALAGKTLEDIEEEYKAALRDGTYVLKSIEESKKEQSRLQWQLWVKDCVNVTNVQRFIYNYSLFGWWYGPVAYERTEAPVNLGHVIEVLAKVHGNQIFEHGVFNGDPHPGNILLCSDGKLGLIDYGQVKVMTAEQRERYAQLILAHAANNVPEVIRLHFDVLGTQTRYRKEDIGYKMSAFYNDRNTHDITSGMSIANFIDYLEAQDPMVKLPEDFIFAARVSVMLRGMGNAFGLQLRMAPMWAEEAKAFLDSRGVAPTTVITSTASTSKTGKVTKGEENALVEKMHDVDKTLQIIRTPHHHSK